MKYQELYNQLVNLETDSVTYTLDELNELLNGRLPNCARNHPHANFANSDGNSYSKAWRLAGFKAKYIKNSNSVVFNRNQENLLERNERENLIENNEPTYNTLLVKNFVGSFNESGIGHEIINSFDSNNNNQDYYIFYVPPYGSIGRETIDFINNPVYRNIQKILVFDSTNITNILKLKAVILNPTPVANENEMNSISSNFIYGPNNTPLSQINFNDDNFQRDRAPEDRVRLFPFTYKINKLNYYNVEKYNLFIWHSRTPQTDNKREDSIRKFRIVYGADTHLTELYNTKLGEKNYSYNTLGDDLEAWFNNHVLPKLVEQNLWILSPVPQELNLEYLYNKNNFLEYVKKLCDENLYTNFICSILEDNHELKDRFFSFLVNNYLNIQNYEPVNLIVEAQCQSLIIPKKVANEYLKAVANNKTEKASKLRRQLSEQWNMTDEAINNLERFIDGQMDIYLNDDNYRIAIENKINSGINGKHDDIDEDINQLQTYKTFLEDLNHYNLDGNNKTNKVILLTPKSVANNFVNYDNEVPVMSYRDLAEFFTNNSGLINERYREDFLNALYKHSVTREEDITKRFFETLQ